ncbi:MAG: S41 family peptidase, partial [Verrucomicrobiota bacterium]
ILMVVTVREDGPAARAGLLPGDHIIKVNNQLTKDIGLSKAIELMRGKPGEKIALTIRRPSTQEFKELEMVREIIKYSSVKDGMMLPESLTAPYKIGYARILQFTGETAIDLANALDKLEQDGMQAFVLDVRNNPGGLLSTSVDTVGEFVPGGTVVLTTEGRPGQGNVKTYRTSLKRKRREQTRDYPIAVLVNHSSASGAEVVAGALQDLKRAIVVGETSFGKGSVQRIIPLQNSGGKAVRMTIAKYYMPESHRTIHENGVIPNIIATMTPKQERQLLDWFNRDSMSPEERKKIEEFEDPQLIRSVDAMKGALVYSDINQDKGEAPDAEEDQPAEPASE